MVFSQLFLQFNTIFIGILIESLPFIMLAVIISGLILIKWILRIIVYKDKKIMIPR